MLKGLEKIASIFHLYLDFGRQYFISGKKWLSFLKNLTKMQIDGLMFRNGQRFLSILGGANWRLVATVTHSMISLRTKWKSLTNS